jgi:hypothetical protein
MTLAPQLFKARCLSPVTREKASRAGLPTRVMGKLKGALEGFRSGAPPAPPVSSPMVAQAPNVPPPAAAFPQALPAQPPVQQASSLASLGQGGPQDIRQLTREIKGLSYFERRAARKQLSKLGLATPPDPLITPTRVLLGVGLGTYGAHKMGTL